MSERKPPAEQVNNAKESALKYLSYRPRTAREVTGKLAEKGFDSEAIDAVIGFLKEYKFIDDDAFARMWIRNRTTLKPTGRRKLISELYQKGIDKDIIESNLTELSPENEELMAASLVKRKLLRSQFNYKKLEGFLSRRGFSPQIIKKVLSSYAKETDFNLSPE